MKKTTVLFTVLSVFIFLSASPQVTSYSFTASTGVYSPITGSSPFLSGNGTDPSRDEGYSNGFPIGFNFIYLGTSYPAISASTNGFVTFGPISTACFSNNLANNIIGRPILAPLWDDLSLSAATDLKYTTIGSAGSRIFILQWDNVYFDFGASAPALSFQLRLYETTNAIEFIYNQLPGLVQDFSGGATIGISGNGNFLSLNNASSLPVVSSVTSTNNITTKPATGQVYKFTPLVCSGPGLAVSSITATSAILSWGNVGGAPSYQYAVTTSATPPASGTSLSGTTTPANNLLPCTQYYLHVRKDCGGGIWSSWNSLRFVTTCSTVDIPYTMPITGVISPDLPVGTTSKDENLDGISWRSYPTGGPGWTDQVVAYVYNNNGTTAANDWLFTQGLNLTTGNTYRLKFKYNNDFTTYYAEKLKVAYGTGATAAAMTNTLADYLSISSTTPQTANLDFTPSASGVYYIGFQAHSDANKDVLILDDISVNLRPSCEKPGALAASVQSSGVAVDISWTAPTIGTPVGYEYAVTGSSTPPASGTAIAGLSTTVNGLTNSSQYYLHVRTNCSGSFSDWSTLAFTTLVNDESCKAIALTIGSAPVCGNTTLATTVPSDPYSNCSTPNNTVWYKYTAVTDGTVVLHITTPAAPARPLHGWANWYIRSGNCPDVSFTNINACSEFGDNGNNDADDLVSPSLSAGTTYYIMIDGLSDDYGEFCISIPACAPALSVRANNITNSSAAISWLGTGIFILEYGAPGFTPGTGTTAGTGGTIINPASSPQMITGLSVATSYDVYIRQNCTGSSQGYGNNSALARFTTEGAAPVNDDCSGAILLTVADFSCAGTTAGTTSNATQSTVLPLPDCGADGGGYDDDVWYKFVPSAGQTSVNIEFGLTSGDGDLVAQIYTSSDNTCAGTFTNYICNDDDGPGSLPLFHNLAVTPGTTYYIRLFTFLKDVKSQFTICVSTALLPNDNAVGALKLLVNAGCTGATYTNVNATQAPAEPTGSCSSLAGYASVWFKFTAPASGAVRVSTATGSGNTLTNSRMALFQVTDVSDYSSFRIIGCDEDGGAAPFAQMSVLYATDLIVGNTYFIQVDKFDNSTPSGTFCITVDSLSAGMLSPNSGCNMPGQQPVASIPGYTGWVSLMDENSKLMALVRNTAGAGTGDFSILQNINTNNVRKDAVSQDYYLDRNYKLSNAAGGNATLSVQLFFSNDELAALQAKDPAAKLSSLRITSQNAAGCQPDFVAGNGDNTELQQTFSNTGNGISWIKFNTTSLSNFYIHSTKSTLSAKIFLQGAYNTTLNRHKDVTTAWANILKTYALNQPYNVPIFGNYAGAESVSPQFFAATTGDTDIIDWVLLEIKNLSGAIMSQRAALVREDGRIVDVDGSPMISLYGLSTSNNYLTIRHRNHLGLSTENTLSFTAKALGISPTAPAYFDFTTAKDDSIYGNSLAFKIVGNYNVMIQGNANANANVRYAGPANDPASVLLFLGGSIGGIINNVYSPNDVNFDGTIRYAGPNNDIGFLLNNALGGMIGAIIAEQKR